MADTNPTVPMKLSTLACFGFLLFGLLSGVEAQTLPGAITDVVLQRKLAGWPLKFVQPTYGVPEDVPGLNAGNGWYFPVHRNSEANAPISLSQIMVFDKDTTQAKATERTAQGYDDGG